MVLQEATKLWYCALNFLWYIRCFLHSLLSLSFDWFSYDVCCVRQLVLFYYSLLACYVSFSNIYRINIF